MRAIIVAAGSASRFSNVHKELLPISETDCTLTWNIKLARDKIKADEIVIVTNIEKIQEHSRATKGYDIEYKITQHPELDMWGSILTGLDTNQGGCLLMADTIFDFHSLYSYFKLPNDINFGVFKTDTPERFSCIIDGKIVTKPKKNRERETAWGYVEWSKLMSTIWLNNTYTHYDEAFNSGLQMQGQTALWSLQYYYDIGTFEAYKAFLTRASAS